MNIRVARQSVARRSVWQGKQGVAVFEVRVLGGFVQVRENTLQRSGRVFCLHLWTVQRSEFSHRQWLLFGCVFWLQKAT